jgi:alkanesulfonate monooxygenase SsuD/methylene tetrahydromethanopterin reductase-like flavin-dependent oxidoreductase (luciferase family)
MQQRNAAMNQPNHFKIGVFTANCDGGQAATKVPERWHASWENNLALAKLLDQSGIDFMLPVARWNGYGGETEFQRESLETLTWATGLLAHTQRINIIGTVQTPLIHPVFAAKQCVTADHVGSGRFGLNIVCGWKADEYQAFGIKSLEHDERYVQGEEWYRVIERAWGDEERFDHQGRYYQLQGVESFPKPWGGQRPMVMNAGSSPAGRDFAARVCDFSLQLIIDLDQAAEVASKMQAEARSHGRDLGVLSSVYVVCRPTQKEAEEYHHYYVDENADWEAAEELMSGFGITGTQSMPPELLQMYRHRFAGGHGTYPVVGDPEFVADQLIRIAKAGFAGTTVAFVNYLDEFPYFAQEVLPRLERAGVRQPFVEQT